MSEIKAGPAFGEGEPFPPVENPEAAAARSAPMGAHAARGAMWTMIQMVGSKSTGILAQFVLGWALTADMWGQAAAAMTVVQFVALVPRFFLTEVLVQRQREFDKLAGPAFWLAFGLGIFFGLLIAIAAPFAGAHYHDPRVTQLMFVLAIQWPLDALCVLPAARMQIDLRFRAISLIGTLANFSLSFSMIGFALLKWQSFAIIAPRPIFVIIQLVAYWAFSPVRVKPFLSLRYWPELFRQGGALSLATYCAGVFVTGDYLALSLFHTESELGVYFLAYNLSTQALQVTASSLGGILFSVLTKLQDEALRQAEAFIRASRSLNILVIFFSVFQATVAQPFLRLLWNHKWDAAVPVLQILSLGMAFAGASGGALALIQAQGRFRFILKYQFVIACLFMICVLIGSVLGGATSVAVAVTLFGVVFNPLFVYLGVKPAGIPFRRVIGIYAAPFLCSLASCAIPWTILRFALLPAIAGGRVPDRAVAFLTCALTGLTALPLYMLLIRKCWPADFAMLAHYAKPLLSRLRRRR